MGKHRKRNKKNHQPSCQQPQPRRPEISNLNTHIKVLAATTAKLEQQGHDVRDWDYWVGGSTAHCPRCHHDFRVYLNTKQVSVKRCLAPTKEANDATL